MCFVKPQLAFFGSTLEQVMEMLLFVFRLIFSVFQRIRIFYHQGLCIVDIPKRSNGNLRALLHPLGLLETGKLDVVQMEESRVVG